MTETIRTETIRIRPWEDAVIDTLGFDPRSIYCEHFWLPSLGPTALLLMRRFAACFDEYPGGTDVDLPELARSLGLGTGPGPNAPIGRTIARLAQFDLAQDAGGALAVRRRLPPINRRHVRRLPVHLQRAHEEWVAAQLAEPPLEGERRNSRRLAVTLVELGEDLEATERTLGAAGYHPAVCRESSAWAWDRQRRARAEALAGTGSEHVGDRPAA
ncbi:MAG: hypothetical protein M3357_17480 [Actinomycetota bacterium]|nr:hypothetical protein [Actinomycetota bacterium]